MPEAMPEEKKLKSGFKRAKALIREYLYQPNETLWTNEKQADLFLAKLMTGIAAVLLLILLFSLLRPFRGTGAGARGILLTAVVLLIVPAGICFALKAKRKWMKLLLLVCLTLALAQVEAVLTSGVVLCLLFPLILSIRYYSPAMTILTGLLSSVFLFVSSYCSVALRLGSVDLNLVELPAGTVLRFPEAGSLYDAVMSQASVDVRQLWRQTALETDLPRLLLLILVTVICTVIASRGRTLLFDEAEEFKKTERLSMELEMAQSIQRNMIPNLYPAFPDRDEFDVFARMEPAKELGGDFYDHYMIDRDHLALIIADVSGKGIPAALFMMASKIIVNNRAKSRTHDPAKILKAVNAQIIANNSAQMFVTLWLGILEIPTGILRCSNAGHEYPCIRQKGGGFKILKDKHSLVLGALEDTEFESYEIQLEPGDCVFVYTDGVTEATNIEEELFGEERMLEALNRDPDADLTTLLDNVQGAMGEFVQEAPQADDFTMLALKYFGGNGEDDNGEAEPEKPEKPEKPQKTGKPEKPEKAEKKEKAEKAEKAGKPGKPDKDG